MNVVLTLCSLADFPQVWKVEELWSSRYLRAPEREHCCERGGIVRTTQFRYIVANCCNFSARSDFFFLLLPFFPFAMLPFPPQQARFFHLLKQGVEIYNSLVTGGHERVGILCLFGHDDIDQAPAMAVGPMVQTRTMLDIPYPYRSIASAIQ